MLVVTTTEWMLHRVLSHTTNLGPTVSFDSILVVGTSSLEERLVGTATSSYNTNLGTHLGAHSFLSTRWETKTCGSFVVVVRDDNGETSRPTRKGSAIADFRFDVAHNGSLWYLLEGENVSASQCGLLPAVDELAGVHALSGNHKFSVALVAIGVQELNLGHRRSTSRIVEDLFDDTTDIAATFRVVDGTKFDSALASAYVGFEDGGFTPSLGLNHQGPHDWFHESWWRALSNVHKRNSGIASVVNDGNKKVVMSTKQSLSRGNPGQEVRPMVRKCDMMKSPR